MEKATPAALRADGYYDPPPNRHVEAAQRYVATRPLLAAQLRTRRKDRIWKWVFVVLTVLLAGLSAWIWIW